MEIIIIILIITFGTGRHSLSTLSLSSPDWAEILLPRSFKNYY